VGTFGLASPLECYNYFIIKDKPGKLLYGKFRTVMKCKGGRWSHIFSGVNGCVGHDDNVKYFTSIHNNISLFN
jgi:hypothetical protein